MEGLPNKLKSKLEERRIANALRTLQSPENLIDFSSNDYLGFSRSEALFEASHNFLTEHGLKKNGATGSRLLSGNHTLFDIVENLLVHFHNSESALIYNSGYDANMGFFSCVPQRGDTIFYDAFSHASIRDGISMSNAQAFKFKHNDLNHLHELIDRTKPEGTVYIVTESVFSMDGDSPDLEKLSLLAAEHRAYLVVDEAHAVGVFGNRGQGLLDSLSLKHPVFARIITFGKAMGCHGAAILGSEVLREYLINFSRSFIYTTALSPHSLAAIQAAYNALLNSRERDILQSNIAFFRSEIIQKKLDAYFIESRSAIHSCIIPGNEKVKRISKQLRDEGFDVKPILSPTVSKGEERLRFCIHSYNSKEDMSNVLKFLATFVP
ncbi:8-amino-7-oxononanoate synthase [Gaetbulibacter sp. M240]|uniref:aminotransferase class I/II-fold pyridoxal phosphate-dependent enzyme n=1 Tax=Gaetbulibacter sp. M240 TaxID=3126511 RepID=UPI00374EF66B